jgi:hypothetical protein
VLTALHFVFRVEIAKCGSFQPIEQFMLKTQNTAANLKLANIKVTQNLGQDEIFLGKTQSFAYQKISFENLEFIMKSLNVINIS